MAGIKVASAQVTDRAMMMVTFSTGEQRIFDASQLEGSAFKPLKDKGSVRGVFDTARRSNLV